MKKIVIGASVKFYAEVSRIRRELVELGFEVTVPDVAREMEKKGDFDEAKQRERYSHLSDDQKRYFVTHLFSKISESDALLVVNNEKHGIEGYIGANVLMEIAVAVYLKKPVFLLYPPSEKLTCWGEVMAVQPIIIHADLRKIQTYFE